MPTMKAINRQLAELHPQYAARFVEAEDCTVDDELAIDFAGSETGWHLQIGSGYFCVNQMTGEGDGTVLIGHGSYRTFKPAFGRLCRLLAREKPFRHPEVRRDFATVLHGGSGAVHRFYETQEAALRAARQRSRRTGDGVDVVLCKDRSPKLWLFKVTRTSDGVRSEKFFNPSSDL